MGVDQSLNQAEAWHEIARITEGRCVLVTYEQDSSSGKAFVADVSQPKGLFRELQKCNAYALWQAGLYLEETDGLSQLNMHTDYDPAALHEDMCSLRTLLGQGVSLLHHLKGGGLVETWDRPDAERAGDLFRNAHATVKYLTSLTQQRIAQGQGVKARQKTNNQGQADAAPSTTARRNAMAANEPSAKREPLYKLTSEGSVRAAIWVNTNQATQEEYFTVSFYRSYRDKSSEWKTSTSFRPQDLAGVMQLAEKAQNIIQHELTARKGQQQQAQPGLEADCEPEIDS